MEEWKIETKGGFTDLSSFQGGSASGVTIHGGFTKEKELKLDGDTFDIAWDPWSEYNDTDYKLKTGKKYDTPTTTLKSFKNPTGNAKESESKENIFRDAVKVLENSVGTDDKGNPLKSARGYAEEWGLNKAPNLRSIFNVGSDTLNVLADFIDTANELSEVTKTDPNKEWWQNAFIGEWDPEKTLKEYYGGTFTTHNRFGEFPEEVFDIKLKEMAFDSTNLYYEDRNEKKDPLGHKVVRIKGSEEFESTNLILPKTISTGTGDDGKPIYQKIPNENIRAGLKQLQDSATYKAVRFKNYELRGNEIVGIDEGDEYHVQEKDLVGEERKGNKTFFTYSVPTEDVYIGHYISKVYSDVKKFQNIFAKIYSVKPANTASFEAQFKFAGESTWTDLDFRYEGIEIPEQKKETFNINYGPTGFDAVKTPLGIQDNEFTIKVLLSKDLREFFHFAKKVGFGYIDAKKGLNLNYITSHEERGKDCTLYLKMRSNAWQSQIGTGGYNVNQLTKKYKDNVPEGLIDVNKPMPQWVFEKFKVRTIKFPLNFDFTAKRPAELTLVCSALYVYPTF